MHRIWLTIGIIIVLFLTTAGNAVAEKPPKAMSSWGIIIGDAGGQGVVLIGVNNNSPASTAGLKIQDILLSINGVPVHSAAEFRAVKNDFPLYTPLKLVVRRNGTLIERQIRLSGIIPLEVKPIKSEFIIPGVPPSPTPGELSAIEALDQINVLDQIVLDPGTGKIAVLGHYDTRFNTGPIPYLDMLKTAMLYPKPKFNLNHSPEVKKSEEESEVWRWPANEFILGHPALEQERQLLIRLWAKACGLSPEELVRLYDYVHFDSKQVVPPSDVQTIQSRILKNLGFTEAAKAYDLINQGSTDNAIKALQVLGRGTEAQAILSRSGGDPSKAQGAMTAAVYLAILENIRAPEAIVANLRAGLDQDRSTWQEVVMKAQGRMLPTISNIDKRDIVMLAINKILISSKGTSAIMKNPLEGEVVLDPINLDRTSQLTRILYEADYSLKSLVVMPQLYWHIPGSMSQPEYYIHKGLIDKNPSKPDLTNHIGSTDFWIEPKLVAMTVSPDHRVVSFGLPQMDFKSITSLDKEYAKGHSDDVSNYYNEWCAVLINHYDEYARITPAFHKVREAAKIIALANWLITNKVPVDLSGLRQEKWDAPQRVPGFWKSSFIYAQAEDGTYASFISDKASFSGGVVFTKPMSNWTKVTPAPQTETAVLSQLTLSAGLGQKAVLAAQAGNLEDARYLAELSAQAMSGRLAQGDLAKLKISVPEAKPIPVSPANVQLQKEMIKKTYQQITVLKQNPASAQTATVALNQLSNLYDQVRDKPAAASDYLIQLQTGKLPPPPAVKATAARTPAETICGESSLGDLGMPAERLEYLTRRMKDAQDRLKHINEALRKLIALNMAQQAEIDKLTAEITEEYNKAWDRVGDVVIDLLKDVSMDAFEAVHAKRIKDLDDAISGKIAAKTATWYNEAAQKAMEKSLDDDIKLLQSAKFHLEEAYEPTKNLIAVFKGANYYKNIDEWMAKNKDSMERLKTSWSLLGNLALEHPALEKWLGKKSFFYGNRLWQVAAMGRMAYYAWGFFEDIAGQLLIWRPMVNRMQNSLKDNIQGMERLRERAAQTSQEIDCLEKLLH